MTRTPPPVNVYAKHRSALALGALATTRPRAVKIPNPLHSIGVSNPTYVAIDSFQNTIQSKNGKADLDLDQ
jgi:hypothetical protein